MSIGRDRDEILYDKVQEDSEIDRLESHIERLYKENAKLKERLKGYEDMYNSCKPVQEGM